MKKNELPECPIETALLLFGEKWKFLILRELLGGPKRFKDLRKAVNGISDRMLSVKLGALVDDGLITKKIFAQVPPKVEYAMSELGGSLTEVFSSLYVWGEGYQQLVYSGRLKLDPPEKTEE